MAAVFGGLHSDTYDRQYGDTYLFKRIGNYLSAHKRLVVLGLLGFLLVGLARALRPVFISAAVDAMVAAGDLLNLVLLVLTLIAITEFICNYGRRRFTVVVIGRIVARMRKDCFAAAIERDLAFYDRHKSGAVISRITSDTQEFGDVMLLGSEVISQFLSVTILFAALLSYSVEMTIVLLFTMPLVVFAALAFRYLARIVTRQGARAMAVVNDNIQESVTGISVAKNFRQEAMIYDEFSPSTISVTGLICGAVSFFRWCSPRWAYSPQSLFRSSSGQAPIQFWPASSARVPGIYTSRASIVSGFPS